jgi:dihydropteroate synthase
LPSMPELRARLGSLQVGDGLPVAIAGVLNLGRESFYPGSVVKPGQVYERALRMVEEGASLLDVGAMSTRPGAVVVSAEEERERVSQAFESLRGIGVPLSVDTQRASVAEVALRKGAEVVNDVSGFKSDPGMAKVVAENGASAILMASWVRPGETLLARREGSEAISTLDGVVEALRSSLELALKAGVDEEKIVVDPGIGFSVGPQTSSGPQVTEGRWHERDVRVLAGLRRLRVLGRPICVGASRKSFIGRILGLPDPSDRLAGSLGASVMAVVNGAHVLRTHDVRETVHAVRVAEAILQMSTTA